MRNFAYLFLILSFVVFNSSCQCNSENSKQIVKKISNTTLLLSGYIYEEGAFLFQPYDLSEKTNPKPKDLFSIKPVQEKFKYVYPIAFTDKYICFQGLDKFYHRREERDKPEHTLMLYKIGQDAKDKPLFEEKYESYPGTAYHSIGDQLFVGCNNEVRLATFKDDKISMKTLYNFDGTNGNWNFHNKTIDAFVEFGDDRLLAIDDVIAPFYGFIFDIKDSNKPKYASTIDLPTYINLHYEDAVSDKDTIYALGYYGFRTGEGFLIYALKYEKSKLYIKYIYRIDTDKEIDEEIQKKYWDYPLLLRKIYLVGDKIILIGVDGLIELTTKPENAKSDKAKLLSVDEYNDDDQSDTKELYIDAYDEMKVHKFGDIITSIEVKDDIIYAMVIETEQTQTKPKSEDGKAVERKSKLLVLKYDKENKLETINTIDVDKRLTGIFNDK